MSDYVFDTESNGFVEEADTIWVVSFKELISGDKVTFDIHDKDFPSKVEKFLREANRIICHNVVGHDIPLMEKIWGLNVWDFKEPEQIVDTYLLSQIARPDLRKHPDCSTKAGPHSLENWGAKLGRVKPGHEDWSKYSDDMKHRCEEDVEINYLMFKELSKDFTSWEALALEGEFFKSLQWQKARGFKVDRGKIHSLLNQFSYEIDKIDSDILPKLPKVLDIKESKSGGEYKHLKKPFKANGELCQYAMVYATNNYPDSLDVICGPFSRIGFEEMNLGSPDQIKTYLLSVGWVPLEWNINKITKLRTSPKLSQDDEFLGINSDLGKQVALRMVIKHRRSMVEGFLKRIRGDDGAIEAGVSGLTPTARLKHKGIVNIPGNTALYGKDCRSIFIAREGHKIVGCDAASCQLRFLAHYMGNAEYTDAVVNGKKAEGTDPHTINMRASGVKSYEDAKTLIYAVLFGAGLPKLAVSLGVSPTEASKIKSRLIKKLYGLGELIDNLSRVYKQRGYLIGLDKRRIKVRSNHMLLVYLLQTAEAVMMKVATVIAQKEVTLRGLDAHLVAHMHDEYQWEVIDSDCEEVAELLVESIVKAGIQLNLNVPMGGEAKIGMNWSETH